MITQMLSAEAQTWLKANAARLEAEEDAWMDADNRGEAVGDYPTRSLEQMLLAELIECLGAKSARAFCESLFPEKGWGSIGERADA